MLPFFHHQSESPVGMRAVAFAGAVAFAAFIATHPSAARGALAAAGSVVSCSLPTACLAETNHAAGPALTAASAKGAGLVATSTYATGAIVRSAAQSGLEAYNAGSVAGADVYALDSTPHGNAIYAISKRGIAGYFENTSNAGVADTEPTLVARAGTSSTRAAVLDVADANNAAVASFDDSGNLTLAGQLFTSGGCSQGCARKRILSYATREAQPMSEDVGEATLVAGRAEVSLEPSFSSTIDVRRPYLVTLTPEGESRGLFVAARSPNGFVVREAQGGRSYIPFSYRISAKPYGIPDIRLPVAELAAPRPALSTNANR
jgi:hypothetical protein